MVFIEHPDEDIVFLLSFVKITQYLSTFQKIWYGAQMFLGYSDNGITCSLSILLYEHDNNMH
jgi:hypothetical protein